eukprot:10412998-Alexandrium_andersonii.AAC.1
MGDGDASIRQPPLFLRRADRVPLRGRRVSSWTTATRAPRQLRPPLRHEGVVDSLPAPAMPWAAFGSFPEGSPLRRRGVTRLAAGLSLPRGEPCFPCPPPVLHGAGYRNCPP